MAGEDDNTGSTPRGWSPSERDAFRKRASELGEKLERHRLDNERPKRSNASSGAFGQALKMAIEPLVGVLFGLGIGLGLDHLFGTKPIMLIVFLLIGAAAGMSNLIRSAMKTSSHGQATSKQDTGSISGPGK